MSEPVSREVSLREILDAMARLPDDTPLRWYQVTAGTTAGWASPGDALLVTLGQVRAELAALEAAARVPSLPGTCPCTVVAPCSSSCTCAQPVMSGGCRRCCTYGSEEQRRAGAERLARILDDYEDEVAIAEQVAELLENPPEPSEKLRALFREHKKDDP